MASIQHGNQKRGRCPLTQTAKVHDVNAFYRLRSVPGIGKILALVLLYEIHDIHRFPRVQDFVSYCRLVKCAKQSDGKHYGYSGTKIGNAHLKWAFSEAAVLCLHGNPAAQRYWLASPPSMARPRRSRSWPTSWRARSTTCSAANTPSTR